MKTTLLLCMLAVITVTVEAQTTIKPCTTDTMYRQFDFWIGDWDVFSPAGKKAGESHVALLLDSCVIFENWTSGAGYNGKSFNLYDISKKQWQQTWVDDKGGITEYFGGYNGVKMELITKPFEFKKDTMAIRKMSFYKLSPLKVRQHGEISKDGGQTWATEFDLEYRRKEE